MDWTLEVVLIPVADVDRAKAFYEQVGFRVDVDTEPAPGFRVVQLTPPGSACSVIIGTGMPQAAPGTYEGTHLCVADIVAADEELTRRGVETSGIFHFGEAGQVEGPNPDRIDYGSYLRFADPDGNTWLVQDVPSRAG